MDKFERDLITITKKLEKDAIRHQKQKEIAERRKQGYEPKCYICTHPYVEEIETAREEGATLEELKDQFNLDCSIQSISRHFRRHYPLKEKYELKQKKMVLEIVINTITAYPFLKSYFEEKEYDYIYEFTNKRGFCTDSMNLCDLVNCGEVSNCVSEQLRLNHLLKEKLGGWYLSSDKETIQILKHKIDCNTCFMQNTNKRLNIIEKILTDHFYDADTNNNELLFNLKTKYDGDIGALVKDLAHLKNGEN